MSRSPAGKRAITCIDEEGRTRWLTEDSGAGDWLDYVAEVEGVKRRSTMRRNHSLRAPPNGAEISRDVAGH